LVECEAVSDPRQAGSAALAQLVEQLLRKEKVDSSIPSSGTIKINNLEKPPNVVLLLFGFMAQPVAQFGVERQVQEAPNFGF
jgi:hypothetical protein